MPDVGKNLNKYSEVEMENRLTLVRREVVNYS